MSISEVHPVNNHALVQLGSLMQLNKIAVAVGKYDTHTTGTVVEVQADEAHSSLAASIFGQKIYFSEFKEGTKMTRDGVEYAFVKLDDIEGYEEVEQTD